MNNHHRINRIRIAMLCAGRVNLNTMDDKRRIRIMRNALQTILLEAKEPIMKVYAQSALDETVDDVVGPDRNSHCKNHNWFGAKEEKCPLCNVG